MSAYHMNIEAQEWGLFQRSEASVGLFNHLSAWDSYPLRILDFVELRVPPLISN